MNDMSHTVRIDRILYERVVLIAAQRTLDIQQHVSPREVIEDYIRRGIACDHIPTTAS